MVQSEILYLKICIFTVYENLVTNYRYFHCFFFSVLLLLLLLLFTYFFYVCYI